MGTHNGISRISERTVEQAVTSLDSVSESDGTISNAVICGFESVNKRRYPKEVLVRDHKKYEGAKIYLNHADGGRSVQDWVGVISNVRPGDDGRPRGTIRLFKSDPNVPKILEAASISPNSFGLSHVAMCVTRREEGVDIVESIESIESVDIVTQPATNKGLFESKKPARKGKHMSKLREVLESIEKQLEGTKRRKFRKALVEMDDMSMMDTDVSTPDAVTGDDASATDPDQAIDDAFKQAMHAQIDALMDGSHTLAELISKIRDLGKAHGKLTGTKDNADSDEGEDEEPVEDETEDKKEEGIKVGTVMDAIAECEAAGVQPSGKLIAVLAKLTAKEDRQAVIEASKKKESKPVSKSRESVTHQQVTTVANSKEFAALIRD